MNDQDRTEARSIFNIGSQNAAHINNVARDMIHYGDQQSRASFTLTDARRDITSIREGFETLALPPTERRVAERAIRDAEQEVSKPSPNNRKVARHLEEFTQVLVKLGALAGAGAALIAPLQRLAAWLGPVGLTLASFLPV